MTVPTNRLVLGRTKTPWARRRISPSAARRERARSTALRAPCFRKRAPVKGLPRGSFRMAARTAFAVDMVAPFLVQIYSDSLDKCKGWYRTPGRGFNARWGCPNQGPRMPCDAAWRADRTSAAPQRVAGIACPRGARRGVQERDAGCSNVQLAMRQRCLIDGRAVRVHMPRSWRKVCRRASFVRKCPPNHDSSCAPRSASNSA